MAYRDIKYYNLLSAQAATGESEQIQVSDYRTVMIAFGTASSANLTVKIKGGIKLKGSDGTLTTPDLSAARSATNVWEYVQGVDTEDGASIAGDTGLPWAGTDDYRVLEVNTNALDFISVEVTERSAGSVSAYMSAVDNQ